MPDYQLGKIYKIVGNGKIYVGSTCERLLCQRLSGHNRAYRRHLNGNYGCCSAFQCITDKNHFIELLEICPCNSKDELHLCERKWIEKLDCVNKCIPIRTDEEAKQNCAKSSLEYYHNTKEARKETIKENAKKNYLKRKLLKNI